ncbi:MAG TPA: cupin domain-containing protein [Acidimicrobiia bacterium]|nr:cupin domain-containing protein [Acidimicrobiia bacterium]
MTDSIAELTAPSSVVARAAAAERLVFRDGSAMTLLADGPATGGTLSVHHTSLSRGADGASPHHHGVVSEVFYVVDGRVDLLVGDEIVELGAGDFASVAPGVTHAFAAAPGSDAELLVAVAPGIERFSLFRRFERISAGREPAPTLLDGQAEYDTYPDVSELWERARRHPSDPKEQP